MFTNGLRWLTLEKQNSSLNQLLPVCNVMVYFFYEEFLKMHRGVEILQSLNVKFYNLKASLVYKHSGKESVLAS